MSTESRIGGASTTQIAGLLGLSEEALLRRIEMDGLSDGVNRGWVSPRVVVELCKEALPTRDLSEAVPLIKSAFTVARDSGKSGWESMSIPVLKNRLLQLSGHDFNEQDYGSPNIWTFVTKFPTLLEAGGDYPRERALLLNAESVAGEIVSASGPDEMDATGLSPKRERVRADLWRAVFDYSSGKGYVWDEVIGRARERSEPESAAARSFPTISAEEFATHRHRFVQDLEGPLSEFEKEQVEHWASRNAPTHALPARLRGLWQQRLRSIAAARVEEFFQGAGLTAPPDVLIAAEPSPARDDVEAMRRLAHRYIDAMTAAELSRMPFELEIASRLTR